MEQTSRPHIDRLDLRIREQFTVIEVNLGRAELRLHGARALRLHIADGYELDAFMSGKGRQMRRLSPAVRADDPDTKFAHGSVRPIAAT